jgi:hypothetical protein
MNFTLCRVNTVLKRVGLELKTPRTDGVYTIKRISDNKVVAAIHPITRRFWVKRNTKQGVNGDFVTLTDQIMSFNDLKYFAMEALQY